MYRCRGLAPVWLSQAVAHAAHSRGGSDAPPLLIAVRECDGVDEDTLELVSSGLEALQLVAGAQLAPVDFLS